MSSGRYCRLTGIGQKTCSRTQFRNECSLAQHKNTLISSGIEGFSPVPGHAKCAQRTDLRTRKVAGTCFRKAFKQCARSPAHLQAMPAAIGYTVKECIGNGVLEATTGTAFKLFLICGFIGWLLNTNRLPEDTAPVLSKVAFNVMIPCMTFTKVASTIATSSELSMFIVPLLAVFQIAVGAVGGHMVNRLLDPRQVRRIGWHPLNPAKSANAIAASTAAASGIPQAPEVLMPSGSVLPRGTRELVTACCTFGNSFTLPLVFMMSLFPQSAFDRAVGYTALFLASWSPCLWGFGYQFLSSAAVPTSEDHKQGPLHSFDEEDLDTAHMALLLNPDKQDPHTNEVAIRSRLALRRAFSDLKRRLQKVFNPPLVGIALGVALGLSPAGPPLFCPNLPTNFPMELQVFLGFGKLVVEMLQLLAGGSLALQSTVLAASLFQRLPNDDKPQQSAPQRQLLALPGGQGSLRPGITSEEDKPASRLTQLASSKGPSRNGPGRQTKAEIRAQDHNLLAILVPGSSLEYKMIAAISVIRFGIVPMASWMAVRICARLGLLPADHVCVLAILIQSCMPPAQNLALLVNLRSSTRFLAPQLARLLLRMYAVSVIPVTFWITLFVSRIPMPLAVL